MHEEIKSILNSGNAFYRFLRLLSFRLLSRNLKITVYYTKITHLLFYGYKTWSLTLREVYRLREYEKRVLRRIFGP
jgi:hypothetical protein